MSRIKTGIISGLAFGIIDIIPMIFMVISDRNLAIIGGTVIGLLVNRK
jgi:hypothetical protein